jgi:hypothetical protein
MTAFSPVALMGPEEYMLNNSYLQYVSYYCRMLACDQFRKHSIEIGTFKQLEYFVI